MSDAKELKLRPYQDLIVDHILEHRRCAVFASMGTGKEQPVSEPVLTPSGWRAIGSLRVGDQVIGAEGHPTEVTGVFPQGPKGVYLLRFADGASTRAGLEHLWAVQTPRAKCEGKGYSVLSTQELVSKGLRDSSGNRRWGVPLVAPVAFPLKDLPVDPYLLGVILGDGSIRLDGGVSITSDDEITAQWEGRIEDHESEGVSTLVIGSKRNPSLTSGIKALGLGGKRSWEKWIPPEYLTASAGQRLSLLQGLLDTDGYAMAKGGVEFSSTAEALADGVAELARSLGGIARKSVGRFTRHQGGIGRESWRVNVKLPTEMNPFRLSRKLTSWVRPTKYPACRMLDSIELIGEEESVCIAVAAKDHLYVTRDYVVTHNTVSTLTALDRLSMVDDPYPALMLAPLRVAQSTWPDEVSKWKQLSHMSVLPVVGSADARAAALRIDAPIHSINYENLPWLREHFGDRWPYKTVVADESTKLKSFRLRQGSKRAAALGKVAHTHVKNFIELTGTPAPNGLLDLWGPMWFVDAGQRLGRTMDAYKSRWFRPAPSGFGVIPLPHAQAEIEDRLRDICLTVRARDWFDLHEPIVTPVYVDLPPKVRSLYKDMEKDLFMQFDGVEVEAFNAAAKSQKLLQLASGAVYVDPVTDGDEAPRGAKEWKVLHDLKLQALESIVEEACGMPVMVAYHFKSDLARLKKYFPQGRELDKNAKTLKDWNAGKIPLLFAHPASAGHGLNLQDGGNILVYFSHDWNLEYREQILERIGPTRQLQAGYDRPVFVYNIIARGTMDEVVIARTEDKSTLQEAFVAAMRRVLEGS